MLEAMRKVDKIFDDQKKDLTLQIKTVLTNSREKVIKEMANIDEAEWTSEIETEKDDKLKKKLAVDILKRRLEVLIGAELVQVIGELQLKIKAQLSISFKPAALLVGAAGYGLLFAASPIALGAVGTGFVFLTGGTIGAISASTAMEVGAGLTIASGGLFALVVGLVSLGFITGGLLFSFLGLFNAISFNFSFRAETAAVLYDNLNANDLAEFLLKNLKEKYQAEINVIQDNIKHLEILIDKTNSANFTVNPKTSANLLKCAKLIEEFALQLED